MSTASLYPQIISELDQLRKRWRQVELLKAIGLVLARIVLLWLVFGVIDGYLKFSSSGRVLAGTVLWGSAIIWVWSHIVQLFLIEHRDDYFAMLVEEKHPELHNRLINALQLGRGHVYGSPRLVEAVISDARQATSDLDLPACAPWQNARQAAAIAGGTVLLLLIVSVFPRISTGLARIIFPWTDRAPYSYTTIIAESIKPLDRARYPEGSDLTFEVQLAGETSATATLWYSTDGEQWRTQNMNADPRDPTRFAAMLPAVNQSLTHYVAAGDAESNMRTVEIVPRPRIEKLSVGYRYPEYAQQPAQQPGETSGDLAALLGSHVELVVECSKPLRKAFLQTDGGLSLPLTISADNAKSARIRFLLGSEQFKLTSTMNAPLLIGPTRYQLQLTDTDGYDNRDALWHSITPLPDHPPQITWLKPGRDIQAKPDDTVKLSLQSRDDIGLAETRIVYRVNEQSEVVELQRISQERLTSTNDVDWELSAHKLRPGDSLQYWAVTTDRNTLTGAGVTESRKFSITLIAPEQVIANLDLHIEDYAAVLEELIRLQRENRAQTSAGSPFDQLILREQRIRMQTQKLARVMEQDSLPTGTMVGALDELYTGAMAEVIRIFENGKGAAQASVAEAQRQKSIPLQDEIIRVLEELLARLERNDQARKALKKLQQGDAPAHQQVTESLQQLITQLDQLVNEKTELIGQLEKLPKKPVDEHDEEEWDALKSLEAFNAKWGKWAKGSVNELGKLPTGFVDDFGLRKDVNTVYEEIEAAAQRPKSSPLDVAL
ncbi:MAG: hypothetical protein ACKVT0_14775 [Planctomycetaceae bacterium]